MEQEQARDSAWDEAHEDSVLEDERPYDDGLTAAQHHAVMALLTEPSIAKAARTAGVGERSLHRWLRESAFMAEYRRARREAFSQAIGLTQRASASAVATLLKIMHDASATANARVAAASQVLKFARESIEVDDLAGRIEKLEGAAVEGEGGGS